MRTTNILLLSTIMVFNDFTNNEALAQSEMIGSYVGKESHWTLQVNQDGQFVLLNRERGYLAYHLDTLAFGAWRQEGNFVVLNTPKLFNRRNLSVLVEERVLSKEDSLIVEVLNPYEDFLREKNGGRLLSYKFFIDSNSGKFGPEIYIEENRISKFKLSEYLGDKHYTNRYRFISETK